MLNSAKKIVNSTAKYLYHGAFDGFLVTGGFAFYALFLLQWPMTQLFVDIFIATTIATTLISLYMRYRDNTRSRHYYSMDSKANEIQELMDEVQYYKEKLIEEQQLLKNPASAENPIHRTISDDDRLRIRNKIARLKRLVEGGDGANETIVGLKTSRTLASEFVNKVHQRHVIAVYKALVSAYVFYGSFPLFVMLAINAIIAPPWIAMAIMPVLIFSAASTAFGFFRSYLQESRKVLKFDAAIRESEWIENDALKLATSCENYSTQNEKKKRALQDQGQFFAPTNPAAPRSDQQKTKNSAYLLIKDFNVASGAELRKRVPSLRHLHKPLGHRQPHHVHPPAKTWGEWTASTLHMIGEFLDNLPLIETVFKRIGQYFNAAVCGALVPGGVALFLKFVLGVNFTPFIVTVFTATIIGTTAMSVIFTAFFGARDSRRGAVENHADFTYRLSMEAQYLLNKLEKEYGLIQSPGNAQTAFHRRIAPQDREHIKTVVNNLKSITAQLEAKTQISENFNNNTFVRAFNAFGIGYHSLVTGYAWYMGFPLFVFLTINIVFPITSILAINVTFGLAAATGLFGVVRTLMQQIDHSNSYHSLIDEARALAQSSLELTKHCDKFLNGSQKVGHVRGSNEQMLKALDANNQYHPENGQVEHNGKIKAAKPMITIKRDEALTTKYEFFKAYREPDPSLFKNKLLVEPLIVNSAPSH